MVTADDSSAAARPSSSSSVALIVGVNSEWEEGRREIGDEALYRAFLRLASAKDHPSAAEDDDVRFLKDEQATSHNVTTTLIDCLSKMQRRRRRRQKSRFVFYFGGHGTTDHFCLSQKTKLYHQELASILYDGLLRHQQGDDPAPEVWILLDCCYSGRFYGTLRSLVEQENNRNSNNTPRCCPYICISSTHPEQTAGPAWTLTRTWTEAMNGRTATVDNPKDDEGAASFTTGRVLSYIADEILREKRDIMTVQVSDDYLITSAFPFVTTNLIQGLNCNEDNALFKSPAPPVVGSAVIAKWWGGRPFADAPYFAPCWFRAELLSVTSTADPSMAEVEFHDTVTSVSWKANVPQNKILDPASADRSCTPPALKQALVMLARELKYVTYELTAGTQVWALWNADGEVYPGTVCFDESFPWDKRRWLQRSVRQYDTCTKLAGAAAFVPIWWHEEDTYSLIPRAHCCPCEERDKQETALQVIRQQEASLSSLKSNIKTPREAILRSIASSGKHFVSAVDLFHTRQLSGYWRCEFKWYRARPFDDDGESVEGHFDLLADHVYHKEKGTYCLITWEDDNSCSFHPAWLIKPRT